MTTAEVTGYDDVGPSVLTSRDGKPCAVSAPHMAGSQETTAPWLTYWVTQIAAARRATASACSWAGLTVGTWTVAVAMYLATATPSDPAAMRVSAMPIAAVATRAVGPPSCARPLAVPGRGGGLMARDRRSRGWSGTGSPTRDGRWARDGPRFGAGRRVPGVGGFGGFGPRGVADPTGVWRDPSVAVGTVLISAVAVSATVVSTVMIGTVAVRPRLGGLLVPSGDPSSLGLYRGLHPLAQFGGHRRRCRRSRPGFGCALYALRKLLLGAVFISHSVTPCATRTREDADRMV